MNIIIAGCGKVGSALAEQLSKEGHDITVIDQSSSVVQKLTNAADVIGVVGNSASYSVLKDAGIEIKEMNSGCICCSLVGDFGTSLQEVMKTYTPERILIEPSGVGKLSDVMKAVQDVDMGEEVQLNSAVAVVEASKCKM